MNVSGTTKQTCIQRYPDSCTSMQSSPPTCLSYRHLLLHCPSVCTLLTPPNTQRSSLEGHAAALLRDAQAHAVSPWGNWGCVYDICTCVHRAIHNTCKLSCATTCCILRLMMTHNAFDKQNLGSRTIPWKVPGRKARHMNLVDGLYSGVGARVMYTS